MGTIDSLTREELIGIILKLNEEMATLERRVAHLEQENEDLRSRLGGGSDDSTPTTPEWVKPNRAERRKKERKNRGTWFGRLRETPTKVEDHALATCPDCGRKLSGGTVHNSRQVIDIPETPVSITEHRVIARYCGVCGKTYMPKLDLSDQVIGKHRIGIRLMSLIGYLHIECRMPIEVIQGYG